MTDAFRPAASANLGRFKRAILDLGLIREVEFDRFVAGTLGGVAGLASVLVKAGKLTPYQVAALTQGKARGLVIGNYFILDKLGAGGMGVVFKAKHRRLGRVVALKILLPSLARDHDLLMRFRREVDVAARLSRKSREAREPDRLGRHDLRRTAPRREAVRQAFCRCRAARRTIADGRPLQPPALDAADSGRRRE